MIIHLCIEDIEIKYRRLSKTAREAGRAELSDDDHSYYKMLRLTDGSFDGLKNAKKVYMANILYEYTED